MQDPSLAVVIITNGPGELTTWVKPIAEELHKKLLIQPKTDSAISLRLVLVPCPNGTGKEAQVANNWNCFEKIIQAKYFWNLLISPQKFGFWPKNGLVIFLGGDQFWSVLLAAKLGYKNLTYAEWIARWPRWNDIIAAMSPKVASRVPKKYQDRCIVVGDLMADIPKYDLNNQKNNENCLVALMPGSKKAKLSIGVPFMIEVANRLKKLIPSCEFIIPVAPTTSIDELVYYSSKNNSISHQYKSTIKAVSEKAGERSSQYLITNEGTEIKLLTKYPAHVELTKCNLALTTVGANTAELGALCIPMIVILPTQHLFVMQAWDGIFGVIARIPIVKFIMNFIISKWRLRKGTYLSWPNISSGRQIVPERIGNIKPNQIATEAASWLNSPKRLQGLKEDLESLRGKPGAIEAITKLIIKLLPKVT